MVARGSGVLVLWPHYFDKALSRAKGRRVSLELAVENPSAGAVAQAARSLGLKAELESEAKPPAAWSSRKGRVLVPRGADKKEAVLQQVARRL